MTATTPQTVNSDRYREAYQTLRSLIPQCVSILPAVKYGNADAAAAFVQAGASAIGENRVQDAIERKSQIRQLTEGLYQTHLIGTLQRNKSKKAIETFDCIQSLDRQSILDHLNTLCQAENRTIKGMLQVNLGNEPTKSGFTVEEVQDNLEKLCAFPNVCIVGIMVVAPHIDLYPDLRKRFRIVRQVFDAARHDFPTIETLSMGMSHDYQLAIDEGSTMIRVGSILYGL